MLIQGMTNSFKKEILLGEHDLDTDTLKMALYDSDANLTPATTAYSTDNELAITGYTAGGETITNVSVTLDVDTAIVDFDDVTWSITGTATIRSALIYNTSNSNKSIAVLDFGIDRVLTTTITVSTPDASRLSAIIRIV